MTAVSSKPSAGGTVQNIATSVVYQPFGPLKSLTYGNGLALARTYDQNYWLTGTKVSATGAVRLDLTFDRNENGQLAGVTDNAATGRSASFGYYDSGRLQYGVGPWGDHSYAYDAAGNRTDLRTDTGGVVAYQFAVNSGTNNQVTQVQDANGAAQRNLTYRDGGDLYEDARVGGSTYQYYYNARKRLVVANKDATDAAYYGYDFRNQRVWRQVMTPTYSSTHYVFDQQGHLLAEHNGDTGAVIKQYIWLDDTPLAVIDKSSGTEVVYYIHTGQIDEPLVMTDASKAKVWDAYVEPFGKAQVFGAASANIDLRLPGQWAQMESGGLSQNWNRDYDPTLARYVQSDPIGLDGGQNLYAYVDGRPTEYVDTDGLQLRWVIPRLAPPTPVVPPNYSVPDLLNDLGIHQAKPANDNFSPAQVRDYQKYKNFCNNRPPLPDNTGRGSREYCRALIDRTRHAQICMQLRQEYDGRWEPGRHAQSIIQERNTMIKAQRMFERYCTAKCP